MSTHPLIDFTRVFDIPEYQQRKYPQSNAASFFMEGSWINVPIDVIRKRADMISGWLIDQGFKKGNTVAIVPKMGSPTWMILDFACQQVGLTIVPIHPTSSAEESEFILKESEAVMCVTADGQLYEKFKALSPNVGTLKSLYHLEQGKAGFLSIVNNPADLIHPELARLKSEITPEDTLAILYTSGTSGMPKGAVLTHANVVSNIKSILTLIPLSPGQRVISFLPFSHIFERTSTYAYLAFGVSIFFCESIEFLGRDFKSVRPFFCTCVPRTLEKMYDYLVEQREERTYIKKALITWAMKVGESYKDTRRIGIGFGIKLFFARLLVLNIWRRSLGGNIKYMAVGAAALRPEIGKLFSAAGVKTLSGYGMTEASPFISTNRFQPGLNRFGTVGIPVPGVSIRIDEPDEKGEGEIQVKGPNIMQGYHRRPDLNQQVFTTDGWFKTGDVGKMIDKRFLAITDRKKDIFKTSSGKYVAPQQIENQFIKSSFISQCLISGFNKPFVTAILVPNFSMLQTWCDEQDIHWTSPPFMVHNIKVIAKYQEEVEVLNEPLQGFEKVRKFILADAEWTVESKDLTTSFKPRREKLLERYRNEIERLYE